MKKIICLLFFCISIIQGFANQSPEIVKTGVLIINVSELNLADNSFHADFYLWFRWKGNIDPLKNLEFSNLEDEWDFSDTDLYSANVVLKDGSFYNSYHVRGKFTYNFKLHNYPFDKQDIDIQLKNSIYTANELLYVADTANSNIQPDVVIPGWNIEKLQFKSWQHKYHSNFGLPEVYDSNVYNNISFSVLLSKPVDYFFWKLLLPVLIVLFSGLGTALIHPKYVDARIYAPIGALLTAVFLAQSYSAKLPDISYLVLMDKVYLMAYGTILAGIFHAIYTANMVKDGSEESIIKVKRYDKIYMLVIISALLILSLLILV